jgi:hypothetical protein
MDTLEDAAGLRRQLHLYVEVNAHDFIKYALEQDFHPLVVEFIQTFPEYLYDFESQKIGSVYANPASYEKLSDHLWKMEIARNQIDFEEIELKGAGLLNINMTKIFLEFARDKKHIRPMDVFQNLRSVKARIETLIKENDASKLSELMVGFCTYLGTSMPLFQDDPRKLQNCLDFLLMMPIDQAALFISQIDGYDRLSPSFKYMTKLHLAMMDKDRQYKKKFYDPIVAAGEGNV